MCAKRARKLVRKENSASKNAFDGINTDQNITPNGYWIFGAWALAVALLFRYCCSWQGKD